MDLISDPRRGIIVEWIISTKTGNQDSRHNGYPGQTRMTNSRHFILPTFGIGCSWQKQYALVGRARSAMTCMCMIGGNWKARLNKP